MVTPRALHNNLVILHIHLPQMLFGDSWNLGVFNITITNHFKVINLS